jgi:hypothetical protein
MGPWFLRCDEAIVFVLICKDDVLIAACALEAVECTATWVKRELEAKDKREATLLLGMTVVQSCKDKILWLNKGDTLGLTNNVVVERFGMAVARSVHAPMARRRSCAGEMFPKTDEPNAELAGGLKYLTMLTRQDFAKPVGALSQFMSDPGRQFWIAAQKVLQFVVRTLDHGLQFGGMIWEVIHICYCDACYVWDLDSRKSTTEYI